MRNISVSIKALDHEELEVRVAGSPAGAFVWLISVDMEHIPRLTTDGPNSTDRFYRSRHGDS